MPWVRYVQTKSAGGFGTGSTLAPAASRDAIRETAARAVRERADAQVFRINGPVNCRLQTQTPAHADLFCQWPALERVDGVTLTFAADSVQSAVRMLNCLSAMSFMLK